MRCQLSQMCCQMPDGQPDAPPDALLGAQANDPRVTAPWLQLLGSQLPGSQILRSQNLGLQILRSQLIVRRRAPLGLARDARLACGPVQCAAGVAVAAVQCAAAAATAAARRFEICGHVWLREALQQLSPCDASIVVVTPVSDTRPLA
eukprot:171261-Chlamydomonas_euryale.AAC.1